VAYVDLAQVGFCRAAPDGLGAYHADRLWRTFRAAGAERLVVSGNVTGQFPPWTGCLLRARPDTLAERIRMRANGAGPPLAGDELRGLPPAELPGRVAAAVRIAEALDHTGGFPVDTDGLSVAQVADLVQASLTRPGGRAASGASPRTGIS
jgi:hypothetical protein